LINNHRLTCEWWGWRFCGFVRLEREFGRCWPNRVGNWVTIPKKPVLHTAEWAFSFG